MQMSVFPWLGHSCCWRLIPMACKPRAVQHRCDFPAGMHCLQSEHASIPLQPMFTNSSLTPADSPPQQLQGSWHQPSGSRSPPGLVSHESSPGCRLVFDIDSDPQDLPESAPLTQQRRERSEHNGSQQHMPQWAQQQQQALEQQGNTKQVSGSITGHGIMNNETSDGCRLGLDIDSDSHTELAEQAKQQQRQRQPHSHQDASKSIDDQAIIDASQGCKLVFDIDSDPQDSPEQPLLHVIWQPAVQSHGRSGDSPPSGYCRVSMSQHESQLTDRQALAAGDNLDAMDVCFTHHPKTSISVRHSARYNTPGLYQHSQFAQTPPTAPAGAQNPQQHFRMGPTSSNVGDRLQHSSSDPQASSPVQHDLPMQDQETNSRRHQEAAEQPGPWAAAAQDDDSCPLVFEEEELSLIQKEDEELGVTQGQCCLSSTGLQQMAKTTAMVPESVHPYPNPDPFLQPQPQFQSKHSRQQILHSVTHDSPRRFESLHLQHEHDGCPLVFLSETDQEQHFTAGPDHNTGYMQTHFATAKGQSQHSPQTAPNSPAQHIHGDTVGPAHQQPAHMAGHMAGHMTAHMASHVSSMSQNHAHSSTAPQKNNTGAGSDSVLCDDSQVRAAETSIHNRGHSCYVDGVFGSCGNMHGAQVSRMQL